MINFKFLSENHECIQRKNNNNEYNNRYCKNVTPPVISGGQCNSNKRPMCSLRRNLNISGKGNFQHIPSNQIKFIKMYIKYVNITEKEDQIHSFQ